MSKLTGKYIEVSKSFAAKHKDKVKQTKKTKKDVVDAMDIITNYNDYIGEKIILRTLANDDKP